jgi:oxygen-dependent protoporphyrinogen oxidase
VTERVVVVGAGITGLAAAHRLSRAGIDVRVLEASDRAGGTIRSATIAGLTVEAGPDSFLARKPWAVDLCRELDLGEDLVRAAVGSPGVWTGSRLTPLPRGPLGIPASPGDLWRVRGLPMRAKIRASADLVLPRRRSSSDASVDVILRRRLGRITTERLVEPLLGGVVGADVAGLSAEASFPELARWEREHASLIRGARAASRARPAAEAAGTVFLGLRGGLERLVGALVAAVGPAAIRPDAAVTRIRRTADGYTLSAGSDEMGADAVIVTAPAPGAASVLDEAAPDAAAVLRDIRASSAAVVLLVYADGTGQRLPRSSGFVARRGTLPIGAATLVSRKWPDPAFGSRAVVRAFVPEGPALAAEDPVLIRTAADALATVYALPNEPDDAAVVRWPSSMPRYEVGHLERVAMIEGVLPPGLVLAGKSFRGVGLADCVRQGEEAAGRAAAILARA